MHNGNPLASVVIPTRNRPELVGRAVRSALQQTLTDLEVIVVVDGPDPATVSALKVLQDTDSRLRVLPLPQNRGGSDARNAGIDAAKGKWIALLDDDDEWMPQKLEKQLALGECSSHRYPVISCKIIGRTPSGDSIYPSREPFLPFADYAWRHRGLLQTEGSLYCPTLVAPSALFRECPFTSGLRRHQDWDWVIRAFALPGVGLEFVSEPLVICHSEEDRGSISATPDWRYSFFAGGLFRIFINQSQCVCGEKGRMEWVLSASDLCLQKWKTTSCSSDTVRFRVAASDESQTTHQ
jgi:glycosyltransferase involved in cell wall biosynthesis